MTIDRVTIYRDGTMWCYAAWCGAESDHSDSLPDAATAGDAESEVRKLFGSAIEVRRVEDVNGAMRQDAAPASSDESCEHSKMCGDTCEECGDSCSRRDVGATADGICHDSECPIHGGAR